MAIETSYFFNKGFGNRLNMKIHLREVQLNLAPFQLGGVALWDVELLAKWMFPKIMVPQNGWFISFKWMIWGLKTLFWETSKSRWSIFMHFIPLLALMFVLQAFC